MSTSKQNTVEQRQYGVIFHENNTQVNQVLQATSNTPITPPISMFPIPNVPNFLTPEILDRYKSIADIDLRKESPLEWGDAEAQLLQGLDLNVWDFNTHKLEIANYLNRALETITLPSKVTTVRVAELMVCAWNMASSKDPNQRLFSQQNPLRGKLTRLEDMEREFGYYQLGIRIQAEDATLMQLARSITFLCGSLLRMVVKEEDNIVRAWSSICHQYRTFYKEDIAVRITPDSNCLKRIRSILQNRAVVKNTLAAFLLEYTKLEGQDQEMCKMLYERYLCYTGLHTYRLLLDCAARFKVPVCDLAAVLGHHTTQDALSAAVQIYARNEDKRASSTRKTWHYAKIFNHKVYAVLQTNNCMALVGVLAIIAQKIGIGGSVNPNEIRKIAGYVEAQKEWLSMVADNVVLHFVNKLN